MTRGPLRAIVVDDSNFMRSVITEILSDGGITVVAEASDGAEAIQAVEYHDPDVVTMDVEMPGTDGIEAVEEIMASTPTPILMLSAHTDAGAEATFEALDRGAVDFFTKPSGEVSAGMARFETQLLETVRSVATTDIESHRSVDSMNAPTPPRGEPRPGNEPLLIVGASTGGPKVVESILETLPREHQFRILVVQHMPAEFTERFAHRLDTASAYDVREATDGATVRAGEGLVAPGDAHLAIRATDPLTVGLRSPRSDCSMCPSVDVTMENAARAVSDPIVGVICTGMGEDGAAGIEAVADAGGVAVVQDEETAAVYGMPKRAVETGCVDIVAPAPELAQSVVDAVGQIGGERA